jgi:undecaprenyl-diphosphatase
LIGYLDHIDKALFLFLNGLHTHFFDHVMFWATRGLLWLPLYLLFLYFLFHKYGWNSLLVILVGLLMIVVSDQLSWFVKETVQRLRPSTQPGLMVHIVDAYKGGTYGFYSAHASNTLSVAMFLVIVMGRKYWYVWIPALCWSLLMSYTRIYLGLHYPGDIMAGWLAGFLEGVLFGYGALLILRLLRQKKV